MKKNKILPILLIIVLLVGFTAIFGVDGLLEVLGVSDSSISVIGGADGPTSVFFSDGGSDKATADSDAAPADKPEEVSEDSSEETVEEASIDEDGVYTTCDDVALYIHTYGHLPGNFVTKKQAQKTGWEGGSLEKYLPGKCIGGDHFGNYEGLLPSAKGREWTECDINTLGASSRGAERIIFSNDGLIYYTSDHYKSFQLLYGEP